MVSNLTNLTSAENTYDLVKFVTEITGGIFMGMFIVTVFVIVTAISLKNQEFEKALLMGSFTGFVISIFLRAMELLNFTYVIVFAVIMAFSGTFVYYQSK